MSTDDVSMTTIDASTMARRGGRRGVPFGTIAVLALLTVGGVAWAWLEFFASSGAGGGSGKGSAKAPLVIDGNRLRDGIGSFEADGGWVLASLESAGFEVALGRAYANTGESAIEARYRADEDGEAYRFAMARLAEPVQVNAESKLRLSAYLQTEGSARAAVRVMFVSALDGSTLTTGTPLISAEEWTETAVEVAVPRGMDRAEVQVLAVLPDEGAVARADDVGLAVDRSLAVEPLAIATENGRVLGGVGASVRVTTGEIAVLYGIRPATDDPLLVELDRLGELVPSDLGLTLAATPLDGDGVHLEFTANAGGADGLVFDFPVGSANVAAREGGDSPFAVREPGFEARLTDVLLGSLETRCMLRFPQPVTVRSRPGRGAFSLEVRGGFAFDLVMRFQEAADTGRELTRRGASAKREGRFAAALDAIGEVVRKYPHDDRIAREAQAMRVEILQGLSARVGALRRDGAEARFFDARNGYRRVAEGVDGLIAEYGELHVPQLDALRALQQQMLEGLAALDRQQGADHRSTLRELAAALDESGKPALSAAIEGYIERELGEDR